MTFFRQCGGLILLASLASALAQQTSSPSGTAPLDYEFFKERVQPIFLKKRPGHARCVTCHTHRSPPLQALSSGAHRWNEEQSRRNFEAWTLFVTPGEPAKSRFLLHPLAKEAGGDPFHAGGKHWRSQQDPEWRMLAAWVRGATMARDPAGAGVVRVLQTNSAGDNVHVIDPATNAVADLIEGIEAAHGIAIAPDGARIYLSNEALTTLDVVLARTLQVIKRVPLSGRPNNVAVAKDGSRVYVGIREAPGVVDIIDAASLTKVKEIPVQGPIHNVYVTPDGRHAVAGSIEGRTINVIDAETDTPAWKLTLDAGIRPMAFTRNPDGSTKGIIVQLSDLHGFALVDFQARKEIRRITFPDPPGRKRETEALQGSPSHGLAITPDESLVWATSKYYGGVYAYSLPDFKMVKFVPVGAHPDWLAITPDGKSLYVGVAGDDMTVVVDMETMAVVKKIPVGAVPKRNVAGLLDTP